MSFEFLVAAREVTRLQPTQKHVYLTLASHADSTGLCWPSVDTLVRETGRDLRTVQRALTVLAKESLIKRKDRWMRSTLYWITPYGNDPGKKAASPAESTPHTPATDTPIELPSELPNEIPIAAPTAKAVPAPRPVPPAKAVARPSAKPVVLVIDDVPESLLADWLAVRKSKKQLVLTTTAVDALRAEAAKAGMTINEAIRTCVLAGWARFEAHWVKPKVEAPAPITPPVVQPPKPPVKLASPEVIAAAIASAKERIRVANLEPKDPKAQARATIKSKIDGKPISRASLEFAAFVLGVKHWKDAAASSSI